MLLIRRIRQWTPAGETEPRSVESGFTPTLSAPTLAELLRTPKKFVDQMPAGERWNVYYTQGDSVDAAEGSGREWKSQTLLSFDLDGIEVRGSGPDGEFDPAYVDTFFKAVRVDPDKTGVIYSGNGLHFLVEMRARVSERAWFEKHKLGYEALCTALNEAYAARGLKGQFDLAVFAPNRILRLPGTENRKVGRLSRMTRVVQARLEDQDVTPCGLAGIPEVKPSAAMSERELASFAIDTPAVEAGCGFLRWMKAEPDAVSEPVWYAGLSIIGRLDDAEERALAYADPAHHNRTPEKVKRKMAQAVRASGPRTCENISTLWGGCKDCPHFRHITSPVCIKSESFIATEKTGFHIVTAKGEFKPQFEDLRRFIDRERGYVAHRDTRLIYTHERTHFSRRTQVDIHAYAQDHFRPQPTDRTCREFEALIGRTNVVGKEFFGASSAGKVNLANGVLDLATKTLSPHSREIGFLQCLPFAFDPTAAAPGFERFLREVTLDDAALAAMLLEFIGYIICDRTYAHQKLLVMVGHGSNGKSTILDVMKALVGDGNYSAIGIGEMSNSTDRLSLEGSIANFCDEMPPHSIKNTELLKKLMGGEVSVRALYHNAALVKNLAKFVFSCNDIPDTPDTSHGFYRRLLIAPFNARFTKENAVLNLAEKLKLELSGIFNMALAAYERLQARGHFTESDAADASLAEYRGDNDLIGTWVTDTLTLVDGADSLPLKFLYERFAGDLVAGGHRPMTQTKFTQGLRRSLPGFHARLQQRRVGGTVERVLRGVKLGSGSTDGRTF